jgi:predicted nuclease of predicted toxin-antitoxin system
VRLLLDQNLSRHLVGRLATEFPHSRHVSELGLDVATDREIWDFAAEHDFVIVSRDSDFRQLAFLLGPPPKAIWLRVGNASTDDVLEVVLRYQEAIKQFAVSEDEALLVLPNISDSL